jgi:SNF2 family DNA or RNA helicase
MNKYKLKDHQQEASERSEKENLLLMHCCGSGKTLTSLDIAKKILKKASDPILVVTAKKLIHNAWGEDRTKFTPELDIVPLWANSVEKRKRILHGDRQGFVTNFDTLKNNWDLITSRKYSALFVDESAKAKSHDSQITKSLLALSGFTSRNKFKTKNVIPMRYALSGLSAPNSPAEYWAQVKIITGPGDSIFSENYYTFRSRYFSTIDLGNRMKMFKFRSQRFNEFCDKLSQCIHVVRESELNLPPETHRIHEVELSRAERQAYDTMRRDLVLAIDNKEIMGSTVLVEMMKLRQIANGFIYSEDGTHRIGTSKLEYMKELLKKDGDDQSVIWINFKEEAKILSQIPNSEVVADSKHDYLIDEFKAGKFQHIILNPQSCGHGLTMVNAHHSRYNSMSYSFELALQSRKRINRIGQTVPCFFDYLHGKDTIDSVVHKAVNVKEKMVNSFMDYLEGLQKKKTLSTDGCKDLFRESFTGMLKRETETNLRRAV